MKKLTRADLWSLEEYAEKRPAYRQDVIAHKKNRQIPLGAHARLYFEDEITRGTCLTHNGELVNEMVKSTFKA